MTTWELWINLTNIISWWSDLFLIWRVSSIILLTIFPFVMLFPGGPNIRLSSDPCLLNWAKEEWNWDSVENVVEQANVDWKTTSNRNLHHWWETGDWDVHDDEDKAGQVFDWEDDHAEPDPSMLISDPEVVVLITIPVVEVAMGVANSFSHAADNDPNDNVIMLKWRKKIKMKLNKVKTR